MVVEMDEKMMEKIQNLRQYLPETSKEELEQILKYGEKIRAEGERKKESFWSECGIYDFQKISEYKKLLTYKWEHENELEGKYEYLDKMNKLEKEKFIEEYLYDDMLYSQKPGEMEEKKGREYFYRNLEKGLFVLGEREKLNLIHANIGDKGMIEIAKNIKLSRGVKLLLNYNKIGFEGAEAIVKNMKFKEGVVLDLGENEIGDIGIGVIAKNMEIKEGMTLDFAWNKIGDKGMQSISQMKLKRGVTLDLSYNEFGIIGIKAIADNLELQNGVWLRLCHNKIGSEGAKLILNINLKEGVFLNLSGCELGDKGAEIISKIKLKEGVVLDLGENKIGDEGLEAIMKNMELKDGVKLGLSGNEISEDMKGKLKKRENSCRDRGINCSVDINY